MTKSKRKRISVYLKEEDHEMVKQACVKKNTSMTKAIEFSLIEYIKKILKEK